MEKMIAYCGLNCLECMAFIATQKNDDKERTKVAEIWSKQFGHPFKKEDINCQGCLSNGKELFSHCRVCEVRKCAKGKELENCGYCSDFPCKSVAFIVDNVPAAKAVLEGIRSSL